MRRIGLFLVVAVMFAASIVFLSAPVMAQSTQGDAGMTTGAAQADQGQQNAATQTADTPAAAPVTTSQDAAATNSSPTAQQNTPTAAQTTQPQYDARGCLIDPTGQSLEQAAAAC